MDQKTFDTKNKKIVSQRNAFLLFSVVLAFTTATLSCLLFFKKERVVILPTTGSSLWLEDNKVSDSYLEKFGSYLADLLLTRTPSDVDRKNQLILKHVHPLFYHAAHQQLRQDRDTLIKSDQLLFFRKTRSFINPQDQTFTIEGDLMAFIGKSGEIPTCAQTEKKRFILGFQCQGGKLFLKSLKMENI